MHSDISDAGLIDSITGAIGFRPLDAFVVLPFCEHDEAPMVVADLPSTAQKAVLRRFSTGVTAAARRMICAHSVIVVVYTSAPFGTPSRPFGHEIVWTTCEKMHRSGLHPTAMFCVAADGWGEYTFKNETGPRFARRPLDDLATYPVREL